GGEREGAALGRTRRSLDQRRDRLGGDLSQEDAVAVVTGRDDEILDARMTADERPAGGNGRPQPGPHPDDRPLEARRGDPADVVEQREHAPRRGRLVEAGLLDGAADEHLTAPPRGEAAVAVEEDVPQRTVRRPEREHLAPHRPDGKLGRDARDTGGPRPGCEDDPAGCDPGAAGLDAHETVASPFRGARLGAWDDGRSLPPRPLGAPLDPPF